AVEISFGTNLQVAAPADLTICLGTSTTLQASGAQGYVWSPNVGDCNDPPTCSSLTVSPNLTTTFVVTGDDGMGCTDSDSVTVSVTTGVILTIGNPVEICEGESATLFGEAINQAGIYCSDTLSATGGCDSLHCIELIVKPVIDTTFSGLVICEGDTVIFEGMVLSESGTFCQSYPGSNNCDSTLCLNLEVQPSPQVELILADTTALGNLVNLSIQPTDFDSIFWFGGNLTGQCDGLPNCTDSLTEAGIFDYSVTVENGVGCRSTVSKSTVSTFLCEQEDAEVPNIFTPNNDGVNDTFSVVTPGGEQVLSMEIWNRWGQKVYEGTEPWNGKQDGKEAASDVYVYVIWVGCPTGGNAFEFEERRLVGDVTLAR
ncbi:MAG: gliding motility-associated C-terminal domain-containing protein, partial [Bacteroidota bacterium]